MNTNLALWLYRNTSMQSTDAAAFVRWLTDEQKEIIETAIDAAYQMGATDTASLLEKSE